MNRMLIQSNSEKNQSEKNSHKLGKHLELCYIINEIYGGRRDFDRVGKFYCENIIYFFEDLSYCLGRIIRPSIFFEREEIKIDGELEEICKSIEEQIPENLEEKEEYVKSIQKRFKKYSIQLKEFLENPDEFYHEKNRENIRELLNACENLRNKVYFEIPMN